jgi:hypothetical protein
MLSIVKQLHRISGVRKHLGWLLAELLIVFVGVYAAATLASYQEQQRAEQRKQQLTGLLLKQLSENAEPFLSFTEAAEENLKGLIELHESGQLPEKMPHPHIPPLISMAFGTEGWLALLQAGGIELLDVEVIEAMEDLMDELRFLDDTMRRWRQLVDQLLIPNATQPASEFYDLTTKRLNRKYEWYLSFQQAFISCSRNTYEQMLRVQKILQAE